MRFLASIAILAGGMAWHGAMAAQVMQEEPHAGMIAQGQVVYVESNRCPAGQVMEVTGGDNGRRSGVQSPRLRRCVPRP